MAQGLSAINASICDNYSILLLRCCEANESANMPNARLMYRISVLHNNCGYTVKHKQGNSELDNCSNDIGCMFEQ